MPRTRRAARTGGSVRIHADTHPVIHTRHGPLRPITARRPLTAFVILGQSLSFAGGRRIANNDGGPQHTAGAQIADSIAVPGAAAVAGTQPISARPELPPEQTKLGASEPS